MQEKYAQLALENTVRLLGIDSPSGYTENAAKYVQEQFAQMGYDAKITRKGGVLIDLGGEDAQDALLLEAHTDTLGGSASVPDGVTEAISVDMGCVGEGVQCTERQVSICAKDSGGPYSYDVVRKLIAAAKREGADYAVDVYPHYGSDVEATLRAGYDIRHGLIGAGVYASHGYERSHRDGALNTLKVIEGYLFE